jgi:hypothetical protein
VFLRGSALSRARATTPGPRKEKRWRESGAKSSRLWKVASVDWTRKLLPKLLLLVPLSGCSFAVYNSGPPTAGYADPYFGGGYDTTPQAAYPAHPAPRVPHDPGSSDWPDAQEPANSRPDPRPRPDRPRPRPDRPRPRPGDGADDRPHPGDRPGARPRPKPGPKKPHNKPRKPKPKKPGKPKPPTGSKKPHSKPGKPHPSPHHGGSDSRPEPAPHKPHPRPGSRPKPGTKKPDPKRPNPKPRPKRPDQGTDKADPTSKSGRSPASKGRSSRNTARRARD